MYNIAIKYKETYLPVIIVESEDLAEEIIEAIRLEYRGYFRIESLPKLATRENTDIKSAARNLEKFIDWI